MGRRWVPDAISDSNAVPTDTYRLKIEGLGEVEGGTKGGENAKLPAGCCMYLGEYVIVEPVAYAGLHLKDYFVIGTANDPTANDPKTYEASVGAKSLKRLFIAARATIQEDLDESCRAAVGNEVLAFVTTRAGSQGGEFNDIKRYYKIGERQPGTGANPTPGRPMPSSGNGSTTMPHAPASPAVPRRAETPTGGAAASPAASAKSVKAKKVPTVQCPTCQDEVARDQFAGHMDAHDTSEGEGADGAEA